MDKQALLDIVAPLAPPPAPPPYGWIALGVGCALLIVAGLLYLRWRRNRERRLARAQLKHTAHALRQQRIDPRTAAFQIGSVLRRVFPRTSRDRSSGDWANFSTALDQARYASQMPSAETSAQLLDQAYHFVCARC